MKLLLHTFLILLIMLNLTCSHKKDNCYYLFNIREGTKILGAGSSQFDGEYYQTGSIVNGYNTYDKLNSSYKIEYDTTYGWSIMDDNRVIQYYAPGCTEFYPYNCTSNPFAVLNGNPPAPTTERINILLPMRCGL